MSDRNRKAYIQSVLDRADIKINGDRPWDLHIYDERFYTRVIRDGSLGLGESYMDAWWDSPQLDEFFTKVMRAKLYDTQIAKTPGFYLEWLRGKFFNLQSLARSFHVGEHHYDLGNDLYQLMLDRRMNYSCAYWKNAQTLDEAQEAKLDLISQKLQLKPGMTLLDIGCGWGALMNYAAENHGVSCVGLTVSKEQKALGEKLGEGLNVEFLLQDYRTFNGQFDRVASIGMFEHVGHKNYQVFMDVVRRCLKDNGLFLLHTIGTNTPNYGEAWLNKYIFPNGMLPSPGQISKAAEGRLVVEDWHNFGQDYDRTFVAYFEKFDRNWSMLEGKYGETFYRMWKYFLLSYAGAFRARDLQLWQIVFSKEGILGGYESVR
ncbi:MAG: cyclopropane fatty acyl phospholipid synthase [Cyanobacteria bacterium J007]|nr:MAG: cyclopropane fatty acyl phospholipid synthase [Cyanobacteria bacterium J007]